MTASTRGPAAAISPARSRPPAVSTSACRRMPLARSPSIPRKRSSQRTSSARSTFGSTSESIAGPACSTSSSTSRWHHPLSSAFTRTATVPGAPSPARSTPAARRARLVLGRRGDRVLEVDHDLVGRDARDLGEHPLGRARYGQRGTPGTHGVTLPAPSARTSPAPRSRGRCALLAAEPHQLEPRDRDRRADDGGGDDRQLRDATPQPRGTLPLSPGNAEVARASRRTAGIRPDRASVERQPRRSLAGQGAFVSASARQPLSGRSGGTTTGSASEPAAATISASSGVAMLCSAPRYCPTS